jgi:hypothetical protein
MLLKLIAAVFQTHLYGGTMKRVQRARRRDTANLPDVPGLYRWSEWKALVTVVMRGKSLYVTPPNGVEIKVTPFIAGKFTKAF